MPKKARRKRQQAGKDIEAFLALSWKAFIMPIFRLSATLISGKAVKEYRYRRNLVVDIIGLLILLAVLIVLGTMNLFGSTMPIFQKIAGGIAGLFLLALMIGMLRKRIRRKYTASDISNNLEKALLTMDSTARWYNDEDEANIELVTSLRTLNIDAEYGYKLPNGRIADARVGSGLIEGKLSPNTSDVDRLLGQLTGYTPYGDKLHIVIYGRLSDGARKRIENEISNRYLGKVFLVALSNPKRLRLENN